MLVFGAVFLPFVAVVQANTKRGATRVVYVIRPDTAAGNPDHSQ
jgi:hypothetical protein